MSKQPFHYAFKVKDLESTRTFYIDLLECEEGRSTENWVDFDFFGHQLSAHKSEHIPALDFCGKVDNIAVPMPHFGCIINPSLFTEIAKRLKKAETQFLVEPTLRYEGKVGEQWTMFVLDPSNNPLEFKAYTDEAEVFAS